MTTVQVKLSLAENVKRFVEIVSRYSYEMDLRAGRYVVDAKSLLGIFSLDLSKVLVLEVFAPECGELLREIEPFLA